MAENKSMGLGILIAFLGGISLMILGILGLSVTGQVSYYIQNTLDTSLWQPADKYINSSLTVGLDEDANLKPIYLQAKTQRDFDLGYQSTVLSTVSILIGLVGLIISMAVFFKKPDGILAQIKGVNN